MVRKKDLEKEIERLNEEIAKAGRGRERESQFFILMNSNERTHNKIERESSREYMKSIIRYMGENVWQFIDFKDSSHIFDTTHVKSVNIKFALEAGKGRKKKDGTYSDYSGQVHAHVLMTIKHVSNIQLNNQKLNDLLQPLFNEYYTHDGFVNGKWIPSSKIQDYMTKSSEFSSGVKWTPL